MKITKKQLKQIIKEEISRMSEAVFIAQDNVNSTKEFDDEDDAYDAFVNQYDMEPLRILDVSSGKENASVVWRSEDD